MNLLEVSALSIGIRSPGGPAAPVVEDVSFTIGPGESLGVAGESGSGKSTLLLALMGVVKPGLDHLAGTVRFEGGPMLGQNDSALLGIRGGPLALVPQNAGTALTPSLRIGQQIDESLRLHGEQDGGQRRRRIAELLARVQLPDPDSLSRRYPHQLSGGQLQRVAIAMALAGRPRLLLLDEPTTGLDVTTQLGILELLGKLQRDENMALVCVSHDLGVIAQLCRRLAVMYAGRVVETGRTAAILAAPRHPYAAALLESIPRIADGVLPQSIPGRPPAARERGTGCHFAPRCGSAGDACRERAPPLVDLADGHLTACFHPVAAKSARRRNHTVLPPELGSPVLQLSDVSISYRRPVLFGWRSSNLQPTVKGVTLSLAAGEVLGLVGESGSGKSTLLRAIAGLWPVSGGEIRRPGPAGAEISLETRRQVQLIFQNPDASLNPRQTIGEIIAQPLRLYFGLGPAEIRDTAVQLLADVNLDPRYLSRYPGQLSGGERQRVAIARAFAAKPSVLLCDEITSALDVSVQASVLRLIRDLGQSRGVASLLVSHDLAAVRALSHRIAVLYKGELVEVGPAAAVCETPMHPYTRALLAAVLEPDARKRRHEVLPLEGGNAGDTPCAFAPRCRARLPICLTQAPPWRGGAQQARCHLPADAMEAQTARSRLSV
jgi:peptide/nickel transport system ATP-binding protein